MKFVEVVEKPAKEPEELKCLNCGGKLEHRTKIPYGYITSNTGETQDLWLDTDDYVCRQCEKVFIEEEE